MNKKIYITLLLLLFCVIAMPAGHSFTVVLDPGHGGKDPGALGQIGQEKTINLNVALQLGAMIEKAYPDVKVVYTRTTDKYVTLQERPNIANKADGDLFISIHTNSAESRSAYGAETYTLGLSKSNANFEVAKRENSVLLLEDGNKETYQGFDPTSPDSYIMFEFMQSKYIDQSVEIAYYIQKEFVSIKRYDRGVRQAIFWVLHQVKMPSILVEMGFISNANEEKFLTSKEGQKALATAIFNGFEKYKHEYDKRTVELKVEENDKSQSESNKTKVAKKQNPNDVIFKLQVFSSRKEVDDTHSEMKKLKGYAPIEYTIENKWYKYTCGSTTDYKEILKLKTELNKAFPNAFVVAFKNGKKIPVQDAIKQ